MSAHSKSDDWIINVRSTYYIVSSSPVYEVRIFHLYVNRDITIYVKLRLYKHRITSS